MCSPSSSTTQLDAASIELTSPINTVRLPLAICLRRMWRIGPAIAGAGKPAVATWYSRGWNRWWLVRSITTISPAACDRALAASSPPKPQPMMTTRGLPGFTAMAFDAGAVEEEAEEAMRDKVAGLRKVSVYTSVRARVRRRRRVGTPLQPGGKCPHHRALCCQLLFYESNVSSACQS